MYKRYIYIKSLDQYKYVITYLKFSSQYDDIKTV